jgi:hypothetical protein
MILDDSFPTTCASCHDCWGYRNATLRMTTWSECRWQAADIPCTRWRPQRERVADSSLHRAPPHPTTTRRKKGGAYFLTTTTVVQCMRRSPSSAERIWDAATRFWESRIAQRRLRSFSTGDGDRDVRNQARCSSGRSVRMSLTLSIASSASISLPAFTFPSTGSIRSLALSTTS